MSDIVILDDQKRGFYVSFDPAGTPVFAFNAYWPAGWAMLVLGTWELVGGKEPPSDLLKWLKSEERFLWDAYLAFFN